MERKIFNDTLKSEVFNSEKLPAILEEASGRVSVDASLFDSEELRVILNEATKHLSKYCGLAGFFKKNPSSTYFSYATEVICFDKIEKLDSELAALLSPIRTQLSLRNVSHIDLDTIQKFMEAKVGTGSLISGKRVLHSLEIGLEQIDPGIAKALNKSSGYLSLPNLKKIDPNSARNLKGVSWGLLLGLETIDSETASALVENLPKSAMGRDLFLPNLKSCDRESLKILGQVLFAPSKDQSWNTRPQVVLGLEEIDSQGVSYLSAEGEGFKSYILPLLKQGSVEVFQAMADSWKKARTWGWVIFNSLARLNASEAEALISGVFTDRLSLAGLKQLELGVAEQLSKFKPHKNSLGYSSPTLYLSGLESITAHDAMYLGMLRDFNYLALGGLKSIDASVAAELAKFSGSLDLNGLKSICDDTAKELSKLGSSCRNASDPTDNWWLELNGLTELSDQAAEHLSGFKGKSLVMSGLTKLSGPATQALAKYDGRFGLPKELYDRVTKLRKVGSNAL